MTDRTHPLTGDEQAFVAMGSNLGDREAYLVNATRALAEIRGVDLSGVSRVYETRPVGPAGQGPYLNAVVGLVCGIGARTLLEHLLDIERQAGRLRGPAPWGPRTLDLDLLVYGQCRIDEPGLAVPHPRLAERAFVLEPLCDLHAEGLHPVLGQTFRDLANKVGDPESVRLWPNPIPFGSDAQAPGRRKHPWPSSP